jgi:hypothetical protein
MNWSLGTSDGTMLAYSCRMASLWNLRDRYASAFGCVCFDFNISASLTMSLAEGGPRRRGTLCPCVSCTVDSPVIIDRQVASLLQTSLKDLAVIIASKAKRVPASSGRSVTSSVNTSPLGPADVVDATAHKFVSQACLPRGTCVKRAAVLSRNRVVASFRDTLGRPTEARGVGATHPAVVT